MFEEAMGSYDQSQLIRAIQIGLLCVQPRPEDRPTMSTVVLMLTSDIELPQPKDPSLYQYENFFNMNNLDLDNISQNSFSASSVLAPRSHANFTMFVHLWCSDLPRYVKMIEIRSILYNFYFWISLYLCFNFFYTS